MSDQIPKDLMEKARAICPGIPGHAVAVCICERIARALLEERRAERTRCFLAVDMLTQRFMEAGQVTESIGSNAAAEAIKKCGPIALFGDVVTVPVASINAGAIDSLIAPRLEAARLEERKRCADIAWQGGRAWIAVEIEKGDPA